jgi:polyhydroxyalkanoate synthesis regulator phasin
MAQKTGEPSSDQLRSALREGFTIALGAAAWAFDQGDRLLERWLEQGELSRAQGRRRFDDLRRRTVEGMRNASSAMPITTREQVESLERRVEELTRQVEALRSTQPPPPGGEPPPPRPRIS